MAEAADSRTGDLLWDDWDRPPRIPDSPILHLNGFDGPMDLLLDLAERQRIDLGRISVLQLAEQFVAEAERLTAHVPLERRADWMVVAARLVLLRSRLLSAADPVEAEAAERDATCQAASLEALLVLRRAAAWLAARPQLGVDMFARPAGRSPRVSSYMALMEACLEVLRDRPEPNATGDADVTFRVPAAPFRMAAAITRIRLLLKEQGAMPFSACPPILPAGMTGRERLARSAVASSFAAVLDLARQGETIVEQDAALGVISLTLHDFLPDSCSV